MVSSCHSLVLCLLSSHLIVCCGFTRTPSLSPRVLALKLWLAVDWSHVLSPAPTEEEHNVWNPQLDTLVEYQSGHNLLCCLGSCLCVTCDQTVRSTAQRLLRLVHRRKDVQKARAARTLPIWEAGTASVPGQHEDYSSGQCSVPQKSPWHSSLLASARRLESPTVFAISGCIVLESVVESSLRAAVFGGQIASCRKGFASSGFPGAG